MQNFVNAFQHFYHVSLKTLGWLTAFNSSKKR
jgi:hypothetical protein